MLRLEEEGIARTKPDNPNDDDSAASGVSADSRSGDKDEEPSVAAAEGAAPLLSSSSPPPPPPPPPPSSSSLPLSILAGAGAGSEALLLGGNGSGISQLGGGRKESKLGDSENDGEEKGDDGDEEFPTGEGDRMGGREAVEELATGGGCAGEGVKGDRMGSGGEGAPPSAAPGLRGGGRGREKAARPASPAGVPAAVTGSIECRCGFSGAGLGAGADRGDGAGAGAGFGVGADLGDGSDAGAGAEAGVCLRGRALGSGRGREGGLWLLRAERDIGAWEGEGEGPVAFPGEARKGEGPGSGREDRLSFGRFCAPPTGGFPAVSGTGRVLSPSCCSMSHSSPSNTLDVGGGGGVGRGTLK